jgi:hypothetical protein
MFVHTSRYYHVKNAEYTASDGRIIAYKRRRFLPQGQDLPLLAEVNITQGDRLDLIAARILGDPEMFWCICDANNAMDPMDLTAVMGRIIRVPLPQPR